jgi:hypothetical protein
MATFVVSSQQPESLGVVDFETPEVENTFYTEVTSIDVVTKEEISGLGGVATNFEKFHKIVILSVDVTANCDRSIHLEKVGLSSQKLSTLLQNPKSLIIGKATLAVEVLLEKLEIGLGVSVIFEELLVGRLVHSRSLNVFANTLHGVDLGVVLHGVNSKVDLRDRLLLLDCANGIVDLNVASLLARGRCVGLAFRVHDGRLGGDEARGE